MTDMTADQDIFEPHVVVRVGVIYQRRGEYEGMLFKTEDICPDFVHLSVCDSDLNGVKYKVNHKEFHRDYTQCDRKRRIEGGL